MRIPLTTVNKPESNDATVKQRDITVFLISIAMYRRAWKYRKQEALFCRFALVYVPVAIHQDI